MRNRITVVGLLGILMTACAMTVPGIACAAVVDVVGAVRAQGCGGVPLKADKRLDAAAKSLMRGTVLRAAADAAGYRAVALASIHLGGYERDEELRAVLRLQYCATLAKPEFRDVGVAKRGKEVWLILGGEQKIPADPAAAGRRVLELINQARARPRRCGAKSFAAAPPVSLDNKLTVAAQAHSVEMARYSYFEHEGRDGSTPAQRVTAANYAWRHVGENIAAGPGSAEEVVQGWLQSPGHCANIMTAKFTQMGVAYTQSRDDYGIYWTQVFATPR